jgi:uncharacterized protein YlxW (UPF0749 family)
MTDVNVRNATALHAEQVRLRSESESQKLRIARLESQIIDLTNQLNGVRGMVAMAIGSGPTEGS